MAGEVLRLLEREELDFLLTQEMGQYVGAIDRKLQGSPWRLSTRRGGTFSQRDSGVVMRRKYPSKMRVHDLGGVEWERGQGRPGLHHSRTAISDSIDNGALRVMSVHLPPTPRLDRFPLRDKAHRVAIRHLHEDVHDWKAPLLLGGDWNMQPDVRGTVTSPTPLWLAEHIGAKITGNRIDYVMARDADVREYHRIDFGGADHRPVLFDVVVAA